MGVEVRETPHRRVCSCDRGCPASVEEERTQRRAEVCGEERLLAQVDVDR